ncbi:MAG: DMT family transporter [Candidatus Kryptoniota bacterium]
MRLRGYLSIFAAALFWGSSGTAARFLFEHNISPLLVVESRVMIAAAILTTILLLTNPNLLKIRSADLRDFFLLGVIGVAGSNYTYYAAIKETNVGIAILMQYTAPVLVAVYVICRGIEKIDRIKILAIALSLSGCAIMLGLFSKDVHITSFGIILGALSAFCFAFFNVFNKIACKQYSIWTALNYTLISASVFWIILDLFVNTGIKLNVAENFVPLLIFSFSSVLIPYYFYFTGLRILVPSTAVIVSTLEPVVAIVTAFLILGETLHWMQIAGGIFIVAAVILLEVYRE